MANSNKTKKAPRPKKPPHVLAVDPSRSPTAHYPWADQPSGPGVWTLWVPDDDPRAKGNHKTILRTRDGRPFLKGSDREERHEKALRAALVLAASGLGIRVETGISWRLDVVVDLPLPVLDATRGPGWRALALGGDPEFAPGAVEDATPDRGNLLKMVEDAAAGVLGFADDRQVQGGEVAKRWSTSPGWHLRITRGRTWR